MIKHYPLASFITITFLFSWLLWLPQALYSQGFTTWHNPLWGFGSFGPSLAGVIIIYLLKGKSGLKELWQRIILWKVSFKWYLFIFLFPFTAITAALLIFRASGGEIPAINYAENILIFLPTLFLVLVLGGPLNEELGWRGFMLPHLLNNSNALQASLALGITWAAWHLPLFWISGASQEGIPVLWVLVQITALSFIFTWLHHRTGASLLIALLFHAVLNASGAILPLLPAQMGTPEPYLFTVAIAVGFALYLIIATRGKL